MRKDIAYKRESRRRDGYGLKRYEIVRNIRQKGRGRNLCCLLFMRISYHPGHTRQRNNFLRSTLGVTAGDQNLRLRIFAMDAANCGTCILVGRGCHGTSIENNDICIRSGNSSMQSH